MNISRALLSNNCCKNVLSSSTTDESYRIITVHWSKYFLDTYCKSLTKDCICKFSGNLLSMNFSRHFTGWGFSCSSCRALFFTPPEKLKFSRPTTQSDKINRTLACMTREFEFRPLRRETETGMKRKMGLLLSIWHLCRCSSRFYRKFISYFYLWGVELS